VSGEAYEKKEAIDNKIERNRKLGVVTLDRI
jgi:hypothetical protein